MRAVEEDNGEDKSDDEDEFRDEEDDDIGPEDEDDLEDPTMICSRYRGWLTSRNVLYALRNHSLNNIWSVEDFWPFPIYQHDFGSMTKGINYLGLVYKELQSPWLYCGHSDTVK